MTALMPNGTDNNKCDITATTNMISQVIHCCNVHERKGCQAYLSQSKIRIKYNIDHWGALLHTRVLHVIVNVQLKKKIR